MAHHQVDGLLIGGDQVGVAVAVIGDDEGDAVHASVGGSRDPVDARLAVDGAGHKARVRRQAEGRERQRLLIQVGGLQRKLERAADDSDLIADVGEVRRLAGHRHVQHETFLRVHRGGEAALAIIRGHNRDGVLALVGKCRRKLEAAGAVAVVGECAESRQPGYAERDLVGRLRVSGLHRHRQRAVALDRLIRDRRQLGRLVHREHGDRDRLRRAQIHAGAVAAVGGRERDVEWAGLLVGRRPAEEQRVGIERRAGGQAADGVGEGGRRPVARDERAVRAAGRRDIAWITRVIGHREELNLLVFQHLEIVQVLKHRRRVHVEYDDVRRLGRAGLAVADREPNLVNTLLRIVRRPQEQAGVRIEARTSRQISAGVSQRRAAAGVGGLELDLHRRSFLADGVRRLQQGRRLRIRCDHNGDVLAHLLHAVADGEAHVRIGAGRSVGRRPRQRLVGRVERGTRRQIIGKIRQRVVVRIDGLHRQRQRRAFLAIHRRRQAAERRRQVHALHLDGEGLRRGAAGRIVDLQHHLGLRGADDAWRPRYEPRPGIDRHARRSAVQHVAELVAIAIETNRLVLIGLGDRCRRDRVGNKHGGLIAGRHAGHRRIECDGYAGRIVNRDGLARRTLARFEDAVSRQVAAQVDQPRPVRCTTLGALRLAGELVHRRQMQHHGQEQVVRAGIGERHVEGHCAGLEVAASQIELQIDYRREVRGRSERRVEFLRQVDARAAAYAREHTQLIIVGRQGVKGQHGGPGVESYATEMTGTIPAELPCKT